MRKIYVILVLLLAGTMASAQFSKVSKDQAERVKKSVLLVSLEEEDAKLAGKLAKKQDELEHYKMQIAGRNEALQAAVENYWNFSENIEYIPKSEVNKLLSESKNYVVLAFGKHLDYERLSTGKGANGKPAGWTQETSYRGTRPSQPPTIEYYYNPSTKYTSLANGITTLNLSGNGVALDIYLPNVLPSYTDIIYGLQQMQYTLRYYEADDGNTVWTFIKQIKKNSSGLKSRILLVDKDDLDKGATEEKIKEVYPYPFEIASQEKIDRVIVEKDTAYAYVQIVDTPTGKGNVSAHFISDPGDGTIYCYDSPTVTFGIKGTSIITYNQRIKVQNFKSYCKNIED